MRRLILTRHADSDLGDEDLTDHDRRLSAGGDRDAPQIGNWLEMQGYLPDETLCSTAIRARQTREAMTTLPGPVQMLRKLYLSGVGTLLAHLQQAQGQTVMIVAHNPGIGDFAERLLQEAPAHPRFHDYPTGATLIAEFPVDNWADLRMGTGTAVDFAIPADL